MTVLCGKPMMAAAIAGVMGLVAVPAFAQVEVDGVGFDMDGNIGNANGGSGSNDFNNVVGVDWEDLVTGAISQGDVVVNTATGISCEFVNGNFVHEIGDISVAWKGGTKDFNDFPDWNQKDFSASGKSDLINIATAVWLCDMDFDVLTAPDLIFQFAADRLSTNGTTFVGLWALGNVAEFVGTSVTGSHAIGDILTVTDFQGSIAEGDTVNESLAVYAWVGDGNGTIPNSAKSIDIVVPFGPDAGCVDAGTGDIACTIVNEVSEDANFGAWQFTSGDSGSPIFTHTVGSFVEGTVNLTLATQNPDLCIATGLVETRQSSSISSLLDDLTLLSAPTCGLEVDLICENLGNRFVGDDTFFDYRLTGNVNTTAGSVASVRIDRLLPLDSGNNIVLDIDTVGPVDSGGVPWGPHLFTLEVNGNFDAQVRATGSFGTNEATADSATFACPSVARAGTVLIEKDCVACLVDNGPDLGLGVLIRAAGRVTNTDTTLDGVPIVSFKIFENQAFTDDFMVPHLIATFPEDFLDLTTPDPNDCTDNDGDCRLESGEFVNYSFSYTPNDLPGTTDDIAAADGLAAFEDTVALIEVMGQFGFPITPNAPELAQCFLCVPGTPGFNLNCNP